MNLGKDIKITTCLAYTALSTTPRNGATVDMLGYDGIMAIMTCAGIHNTHVGDIHFETATDSGFSGGTDLEGTAIVTDGTDDDQIFVADLYKPLERYVRAVVVKDATNTAAESVIYIQYKGVKRPEVNTVTDLVTYELNVSPARGTK